MRRITALPGCPASDAEHDILDFDQIRRLLPHGEPFILVDRVVALERGRRIVCLKNLTGAEPIFAGHFPTRAIFPGALLLEAMAQAALLLLLADDATLATGEHAIPVLGGAKVRWLQPARPGDQLRITVTLVRAASIGALLTAEATVDGFMVARADLTVGRAQFDG